MKKITRQIQANRAHKAWIEQYGSGCDDDKLKIGARLKALGDLPDPDAIDKIIGNTSWTCVPCCNECGMDGLDSVIMVGEPPDYESNTAWLCMRCLIKALECIRGDQ